MKHKFEDTFYSCMYCRAFLVPSINWRKYEASRAYYLTRGHLGSIEHELSLDCDEAKEQIKRIKALVTAKRDWLND